MKHLHSHITLSALLLTLILPVTTTAFAAGADTDGDGIPDVSETFLGTDPQKSDTDGDGVNDLKDEKPIFLNSPISQSGKPAPFAIKEALVENNYDFKIKRDAPDHLELQIVNHSATKLSNFSIYFSIKDLDNGKIEAYYTPLVGFMVSPKGEARIHMDDGHQQGHFRENPNGMYKASQTAKLFTVTVKAKGFQPVTTEIKKDPGGAEMAD